MSDLIIGVACLVGIFAVIFVVIAFFAIKLAGPKKSKSKIADEEELDPLDEKLDESLSEVGIAINLLRAAEKTRQAGSDLFIAEGNLLTAEGRRKARIEKQEELNEREMILKVKKVQEEGYLLEDQKKLIDTEVAQAREKINNDLSIGRESIAMDEKLSIENKEHAEKKLARQKEISDKEVNDWVATQQKKLNEQIKLNQNEMEACQKLKRKRHESDLALQKEQEEATAERQRTKERQDDESLLSRMKRKNISAEFDKKKTPRLKAALAFFMIVMTIVGLIAILEKVNTESEKETTMEVKNGR